MKLPTVKINRCGHPVIINLSDYQPDFDTLWEDGETVKVIPEALIDNNVQDEVRSFDSGGDTTEEPEPEEETEDAPYREFIPPETGSHDPGDWWNHK